MCTPVRDQGISSPQTRLTARSFSPENVRTVCVICKGVTSLYRIGEHTQAKAFLAAFQFNKDDVFRRCIFLKTTGDIYAADIMYHSNCMSSYLLAFEQELSRINEICNEMDPGSTDLLASAVDELRSSLQLSTIGYTVSECRDSINTNFERSGVNATISNRQFKQLLVKTFGDKICFSYSYQKSESQMFFSTEIRSGEFVKKIRCTDVITDCAKVLRNECKVFDFGLDSSYCDGNDVSTSQKAFIRNRPGTWDKFFHILFEQSNLSDEKQRVCDVVFQILYKAIHYNQKRTPLHKQYLTYVVLNT